MPVFAKSLGIFIEKSALHMEVVSKSWSSVTSLGKATFAGYDEKDPPVLAAEVAAFFKKVGAKPESAVVTVSPEDVMTRRLQLPPEAEQSIQEVVRLQVLNLFPYDPSDLHVEMCVNKQDGGEKKSIAVDVFAVQKERLLKIMDTLHSLRIQPDVITLDSYGYSCMLRGKTPASTPYFAGDLQDDFFCVHAFRDHVLVNYAKVQVRPDSSRLSQLMGAIDRAGSLARVEDDSDVGVYLDVQSAKWNEDVRGLWSLGYQDFNMLVPFETTAGRHKAGQAAVIGLDKGRIPVNILPYEFRKRTSVFLKAAFYVFASILALSLCFWEIHGWIQEGRYVDKLKQTVARLDGEYKSVLKLRERAAQTQKELDAFQILLKRPVSDILIMKSIAEKTEKPTYFYDYTRSQNLLLSGYTNSVIRLQSKEGLGGIRYFKKVVPEGSINKIKMPQEGEPNKTVDMESFRFNIQLEDRF